MAPFGLGRPTPSRFPYEGRPQPPGAVSGQGQNVRARTVIVSGPGGGVFVYSPSPGPGHLIGSVSNAAFDPFGNPVIAGSASYIPGLAAVAMAAGKFFFYNWTGTAWASFASFIPFGAAVQLSGAPFNSTAGTAAAPTVITTDTWHNVTAFGAGFAAGVPAPQYALLPWGVNGLSALALRGQVVLTAATAVNAVMFTVPFTFGVQADFGGLPTNLAGNALGARLVRLAAGGGNVQCQVVGANTNFVIIDGITGHAS